MSRQNKMIWEKPEITIISRSNPEEAVLKACSSINTVAANVTDGDCVRYANEACRLCETPSAS